VILREKLVAVGLMLVMLLVVSLAWSLSRPHGQGEVMWVNGTVAEMFRNSPVGENYYVTVYNDSNRSYTGVSVSPDEFFNLKIGDRVAAKYVDGWYSGITRVPR
jgi:hypothetical protein